MDTQVQAFLKNHRIAVVSVLQDSGVVHSATIHYAHTEEPLEFFFMTGRQTKKCESLLDGKEVPASLVIGFSEEEFVTLQAEGSVKIATGKEFEQACEVYGKKFEDRSRKTDDPGLAVLYFAPSWWRYRDYKGQSPLERGSEGA